MRSEGDYKYFDNKTVKYDITSINQVIKLANLWMFHDRRNKHKSYPETDQTVS